MVDSVQFYFSFRSPYSWLAMYRMNLIRDHLTIDMEMIPVFPAGDKNDLMLSDQNKVKYIATDVDRLASAYGLAIQWPKPFDTDWLAVHIAYIYADDQGKGMAFCLAVYSARFIEGKDVGDKEIMGELSDRCGLDTDALIEAQDKREYKKKLLQGLAQAGKEGVFGVPFFRYKQTSYWGNDRLEWLVREINHDSGIDIPDLSMDPFKRPY